MNNPLYLQQSTARQPSHYILGVMTWVIGWLVMLWCDPQFDFANLAMLLVLTSAIAALWLPALATLALGVVAILAFDWSFVAPRGTFLVSVPQHGVLLLAMLVVNSLIAVFMASLRAQSRTAERHAAAAETLRYWGDKLRDADEPHTHLPELQQALMFLSHTKVAIFSLNNELPKTITLERGNLLGEADSDQCDALCYSAQHGHALGPNTGRFQEFSDWYFPLRGRSRSFGAALVIDVQETILPMQAQLRALCDQMGIALERRWMVQQQRIIREQAQAQALRNTLLAAISHDYRTPLAIIMGAASSLDEQGERLSQPQRQQFARTILSEADRLNRLTNNILQLARLDVFARQGVVLNGDWQSAEEIIGSVLQRVRLRDPQQRVQSQVELDLPLLWCDSLLISQMLENLVDNALKYTPTNTPVTIIACRSGDTIMLAVRDQGEGIDPYIQEHIFEAFYRGKQSTTDDNARPGVGVGLALCRAIALASGGNLRLQSSAAGASFECVLPIRPQPLLPTFDEAGA